MPLRERAAGEITSLKPAKAVVALQDVAATPCELGEAASAQLKPPDVLPGKVVGKVGQKCEIEFSQALPRFATIGTKIGALIETGVLRDVVFLERPADSSPNSEAVLFVLEPGGQYARRVTVRYGRISGSLIQIVSGVSPGERVIVTDLSQFKASPRIRLQ